jgi:hypothetical protein
MPKTALISHQICTAYRAFALDEADAMPAFGRLTNAHSKKLPNHAAAVSLYVAHYDLSRWYETICSTPAGLSDHAQSIGELN